MLLCRAKETEVSRRTSAKVFTDLLKQSGDDTFISDPPAHAEELQLAPDRLVLRHAWKHAQQILLQIRVEGPRERSTGDDMFQRCRAVRIRWRHYS